MALLSRICRNTVFYNHLKFLHGSTGGSSVPSFDMDKEKKAFEDVLPEVIDSVVTSSKFTDIPEVRSWIKKVSKFHFRIGRYTVHHDSGPFFTD